MGERDRLEAEIHRLAQLDGDQLIEEFVPSVAREKAIAEADVPSFRDSLNRGAMLPRPVDVSRDPPPVRREGGEVGIPWGNQGRGAVPSGVTWTYDKDGNLVRQ